MTLLTLQKDDTARTAGRTRPATPAGASTLPAPPAEPAPVPPIGTAPEPITGAHLGAAPVADVLAAPVAASAGSTALAPPPPLVEFHTAAPDFTARILPVRGAGGAAPDLSASAGPPAAMPPDDAETAAAELAYLLFDGAERDTLHSPWRTLISGEEFRYRPGLTPTERITRSYARLRLLNNAVKDPENLACDPRRLAALHEWTGVVDAALGTVAGIHYNLFLGSLLDHDPDGRRNLTEYTTLQSTGTFLCTELDHGNDIAALETTAHLDPETGGFTLHTPHSGAAKFMPNTSLIGGPKSAVVAARLIIGDHDHGVFLFLTPLSTEDGHLPGVTVTQLPERTGVPLDHCLTTFTQVSLPREALMEADHGRLDDTTGTTTGLGSHRRRFLRSISRVTTGKLCLSAKAVGVSRAALAIAVHHAHNRHISGPKNGERIPLAAHRSHHGRLLYALSTTYAMTLLHRHTLATWADHTPENRPHAERLAAITKAWITWQARDITLEARERCGAQGLFPTNGLADFSQNLESSITAEGDNLVISLKAASEMLFNHTPGDTGITVDGEAARRCDAASGPFAAEGTGGPDPQARAAADLHDLAFLRGLLANAEQIWQTRARTALRQAPPGNPLARWNAASPHALSMVNVHATLLAADTLIAATSRTTHPHTHDLLSHLTRLYLLHQLTNHSADLLASGHLAAHHIQSWPDAIENTITRLAPHLSTLTHAFHLPAPYLAHLPITAGSHP